jgi:hypothetical protein
MWSRIQQIRLRRRPEVRAQKQTAADAADQQAKINQPRINTDETRIWENSMIGLICVSSVSIRGKPAFPLGGYPLTK